MKNKTITFGCTLLNEEDNIETFLNSITEQSIKPQEIVIVDGGSTDRTLEIIKRIQKESKVPIKVVVSKGANIAKGRNIYTRLAKSDLLFSGDASTRFEKDWIKKLLKGFEAGGDVVFGTYVPEEPKTIFDKVVNTRVRDYSKYSEEDWAKEEPSNRQAAYKMSSWKKVGKFPEWMNRADDAWIYEKAKKMGLKFVPVKDAKVYWKPRKSLKEYVNLAYQDSLSDGIAVNIILRRKIYFAEIFVALFFVFSVIYSFFNRIFGFIAMGIVLAIFLAYALKTSLKSKEIIVCIYAGIISVLLFFAHSFGAIIGLIIKLIRLIKREKNR